MYSVGTSLTVDTRQGTEEGTVYYWKVYCLLDRVLRKECQCTRQVTEESTVYQTLDRVLRNVLSTIHDNEESTVYQTLDRVLRNVLCTRWIPRSVVFKLGKTVINSVFIHVHVLSSKQCMYTRTYTVQV